ncbi:hypothetical protein QEZ54_35685 [Catellatospora sp. KI3]|uniref:hypothetical protein n=1 Tax=Catellatospora sp. KI3 TaxID=3041620 RepID=UPI0024832973|nr:hypothetical protein [Catellatospora sp. KI3]MDI1466334.1 hypothetical protein [Catellatospora sp. KI3]
MAAGLALVVVAIAAVIGMFVGSRWRTGPGGAAPPRGGRRAVEAGVRVLRTGVRRVRRRTLRVPRLWRPRRWQRRTLRPGNRNTSA